MTRTLSLTIATAFMLGVFMVAMVAINVDPAEAHNGSHKCANVLRNPTDAKCEAYTRYKHQYRNWTNDRYQQAFANGGRVERHLRLKAAGQVCHRRLFEDFSCG